MPKSILEAVQEGCWDFEPEPCETQRYDATSAMPGSNEKLRVLCQRVQEGLPLWHPEDRRSFEEAAAKDAKAIQGDVNEVR